MGTIYQPIYSQPDSSTIDMSVNQVFSCRVQGNSVNAYQLVIKTLANATLYDSTKITLSSVLYNNEVLNITVNGGTITNTEQLKYTIKVWSGTDTATTREIPFYSYSNPTATLIITSPVTNKKIDLITSYTQAQNISIQSYQYFLYNSTGITILDQSEVIYNEKLTYSFDGLLDATTYQVQCKITTLLSQEVDTGKISFNVDYLQPNINTTPTTEILDSSSAVKINIDAGLQNIGTTTGTFSYIDNFLVADNVGLQLDNNSSISWNINIPQTFTNTFDWVANGFTSGKIVKFENSSGNYMEIGYTAGRFYLNINEDITVGSVITLNTNPYVFGVLNQEIYICQSNIIIDRLKPWWA